jgi:septum formation protein
MIILASQSSARREMLTAAGVAHQAMPAHIDEEAITAALQAETAPPGRIADALAELKAFKLSRANPSRLVLGADTVVVTADGSLLAKPESRLCAEAQLRQLSGTTHTLISAAVIAENGVAVWRADQSVRLTMRPLSAGFITEYLDSEGDAVLDCVGCYRIEGLGAQLFTHIQGDQFTIRGLPLLALLDYLRGRGVLRA